MQILIILIMIVILLMILYMHRDNVVRMDIDVEIHKYMDIGKDENK